MLSWLVLAAIGQPLVSAPAQAQAAQASFGNFRPAPVYEGAASNSFYLRMRDGVRLAVRVDRPANGGRAAEGRFPVIWHHSLSISQQPSDGTGQRVTAFREAPTLVRHGYVVVQVARRGNGQSFGARRGYQDRNEAYDAYEVTQWLAAQPWSDGRVGIYGCSNTGDAGLHATTVRPPALKAAFLGCFSWHKYDAFRRGGIFAQWGTGPTRSIEEDMALPPVDSDPDKRLLRQAAEEHQLSTPLFEMWKQMPFRDSWSSLVASRFWEEGSAANYADQIRRSGVAVYIMGGWFDELRDQGLIAHLNIPGSRVVIGPWKHCENPGFPLLEEMHRFFDQHLKGIDTGLTREPAIRYFTTNAKPGSEWRATDMWPVAGTRMQDFALVDRRLEAEGRRGGQPVSFAVDYDVSCPEAGSGSTVQPCHVPGAGVSFSSPVLARDVEVTGSALADIWVSADAADANVFAYLEDVAPDGQVRVITEGRLKGSLKAAQAAPWKMPAGVPWHRAYAEDSAPLTPGEPVRLQFDLMPTSHVFKAGHRMQVTVTGADNRERARDVAGLARRITIHGDARHRSSVALPVVTQPVAAR